MHGTALVVTNDGATACQLRGAPEITFHASGGLPVGHTPPSDPGPAVDLALSASAELALQC